MKSTVLKKNDSTLTKKYVGLFALLFVIALAVFFDHFLEAPMSVDELPSNAPTLEVRNEVGYMAPDFVARDLKGNRVSLSDFRGQVVVVNMWATWCAPCRVEMPGIENLYRRFRSEGLTVLAISLDKGKDQQVAEFVEEYKLTFPVLLDPEQDAEKNTIRLRSRPPMWSINKVASPRK